jgi:hypothetical protein
VWSHWELSTERHNGEWPSGHRPTSQEYRARRTSRQEFRPQQRDELSTKVLQASRNILAEACGRRSTSAHPGVTRVDRRAFDALCRTGCPAPGWRGPRPRSGPSIWSNPPGLDHRQGAWSGSRAVAFGPPGMQAGSNPAGPPGSTHAETPIGKGSGLQNRGRRLCRFDSWSLHHTSHMGRSSAGRARRWQRRRRSFDPRCLHQHHPLALVAQGTERRRAKPETGGSSPPRGAPGCSPLRVTSRRTGSGWWESPLPRPTSHRGS